MVVVSTRGIYYNLEDSTYTLSLDGNVYFFSSKVYARKMQERYIDNRKRYDWFFKSKRLELDFDFLADLSLYRMIETRGFRVVSEGVELTWQEAREKAVKKLLLKTKHKSGSIKKH